MAELARYDIPLKIGAVLHSIAIFNQNNLSARDAQPIKIGDFTLYPPMNILEKDNQKIRLTDKELEIIKTLYQIAPQKMLRDDLLRKIWGYGEAIETHTLETHIYRLRQKVERNPSEPDFLKTDEDGYFLNF
jgi:DNA-binding response OmpR family regulator